ncbi:uncharacterized mitochondrial protein AtMg00810-like [Beta vulgaris subsp. vulgaris]|uniref:uncharacterized mitochondrial protein AtMg00810-like n=1 Tax=Beta vulgaris subsp. vulgaris TaxID=3555 RepID=UPI002036F62C|nr:uncharacterized mitochondrial protein AtMg00810-like [Beta vulgaris subsp. vulgaris]
MRYFLGLEVPGNDEGTLLNQRKYIHDLIIDSGQGDCKGHKFPMQKGLKLSTEEETLLSEPEQYRRRIGKLLYLNLTRPDISYSVQQLSQFMQNPRQPHLEAALYVIDRGTCAYSGKSLTGNCIFLEVSLISWKTKKQKTVSKSSAEAELRSMSKSASEVTWVDEIYEDLDFCIPKPITPYCDNKAVNYIQSNIS